MLLQKCLLTTLSLLEEGLQKNLKDILFMLRVTKIIIVHHNHIWLTLWSHFIQLYIMPK